jgi:hypothetical protein
MYGRSACEALAASVCSALQGGARAHNIAWYRGVQLGCACACNKGAPFDAAAAGGCSKGLQGGLSTAWVSTSCRLVRGPPPPAPPQSHTGICPGRAGCCCCCCCGCRKRSKGMSPSDYNKGSITPSGLIRCSCHGSDITMSEFEQHSNSQIHRPAEYIFIRSLDMSLKVGGVWRGGGRQREGPAGGGGGRRGGG